MKAEEIREGWIYWDAHHRMPVTVTCAELDALKGVGVKLHHLRDKRRRLSGFMHRASIVTNLHPITHEHLAEFGLEQEGEG